VTDVFEFNTTVHEPVPAQADPPQPEKAQPDAGVAVRVRLVPELYEAEHVVPQLIPVGELVTVPEPLTLKLSEYWPGGAGLNAAVTL
jgi:hypothetical protein